MRNRIVSAAVVGLALLGFGSSVRADDKLIGPVSAVDTGAKTFSVTETGAMESTPFSVDAKTLIREGRKDVPLSSLEVGREVKVTYAKGEGVAVAHRIDVSVPLGADKSKPMPVHTNVTR